MSLPRALLRRWPLTGFGTLSLLLSSVLLAAARYCRNAPAFSAALFLVVLILASAAATRVRRAFLEPGDFLWDIPGPCVARSARPCVRLLSRGAALSGPFRIHLALSGRLRSAGADLFFVSRDCRAEGTGEELFALGIPVSGSLSLSGAFSVRDALGLAKSPIGAETHAEFPVLPAVIPGTAILPERSRAESEERPVHGKRDGERIFFREYVPGDLVRDINWKASLRLGSLLTRVPPESPREAKEVLVTVLMPRIAADPNDLLRMEHLRSLAATVLEGVRAADDSCAISLTVNGRDVRAESGASIEPALAALAASGYDDPSEGLSARPGSILICPASAPTARNHAGPRLLSQPVDGTPPIWGSACRDGDFSVPLLFSFPFVLPSPLAAARLAGRRCSCEALP